MPEPGDAGVDALLDRADALADELAEPRGHGRRRSTPTGSSTFMHGLAELHDLIGRAGSYAGLDFAADTTDPARGARMQKVEERGTAIGTKLLFFELEWAEVPDDRVEALLADERLAFAAHHLRSARRYRPHLLTEPEEVVLTEKSVTGRSAWQRLFEEQVSAISVELDGETTHARSRPRAAARARPRRCAQAAAAAVTDGLAPGLRTRAFVLNTLLADKSIDDRLRHFDSWIASRNLSNEASDESVQALVDAVQGRYSIPQRWYTLKAQLLGIDQLADYDRMASVADVEREIGWDEAKDLVLDAYGVVLGRARRHRARSSSTTPWIDAPARPGKRPGAFCAYTVPSHHPYLLLNWTSRRRDVLTLAHELGHGLHAYLAREQGVFHQTTPLTLAETASVFGETVTFGRLLDDGRPIPQERLALLASNLEDQIATVFRQIAMNRFEDAIHTARREEGELSVEQLGELWAESQHDDARRLGRGHRRLPHVVVVHPALHRDARLRVRVRVRPAARAVGVRAVRGARGPTSCRSYLDLLRAGGSMAPEELGQDRRRRPRRPRLLGPRPRHHRAPPRRDRSRRATRGREDSR